MNGNVWGRVAAGAVVALAFEKRGHPPAPR
jgi:hypothetical protein